MSAESNRCLMLREFGRDVNGRLSVTQGMRASVATTLAVEQTHRRAITSQLATVGVRPVFYGRRVRSMSRWRWLVDGRATVALALGVIGGPEAKAGSVDSTRVHCDRSPCGDMTKAPS